MSLRTRLLLAFAVVVLLPLALLALGFRFEVTRRLSEQYERQLDRTWAGVDADLRGTAAGLQQQLTSLASSLPTTIGFAADWPAFRRSGSTCWIGPPPP